RPHVTSAVRHALGSGKGGAAGKGRAHQAARAEGSSTMSSPSTSTRQVRPAAVLGGNRIPFARAGGPYAQAGNADMLTAALDGLVARFALQGERPGEVAGGAVLKHSRDFNLTRECVLGSQLSPWTPAYDVQQA